MAFKETIKGIENSKYFNWKTIILIYILTRILIVVFLNYGVWNGQSVVCYTVDCQHFFNNAMHVASGENPYIEWQNAGGYAAGIPERADYPPFIYVLLSTFLWLWKDIWALRLQFFIFDFLNLLLIYKIAKFRNISSLLYIIAPSIIRGLIFPEDELFVAFVLASIYFFKKGRYPLSTLMLAFSANIKFFPIILFPILFMNMGIIRKKAESMFPEIKLREFFQHTGIFAITTIILNSFYFPTWLMAYEYRRIYLSVSDRLISKYIFLGDYNIYLVSAIVAISLFFLYSYLKNIDLTSGYLLGSLIFITLYPKLSPDHIIFLIPLFLVWTKINLEDALFYILYFFLIMMAILSLNTIALVSKLHGEISLLLILITLFILVMSNIRKRI